MITYPQTLQDYQELHAIEQSMKKKDFIDRLINAPITIISVAVIIAIFLMYVQ